MLYVKDKRKIYFSLFPKHHNFKMEIFSESTTTEIYYLHNLKKKKEEIFINSYFMLYTIGREYY